MIHLERFGAGLIVAFCIIAITVIFGATLGLVEVVFDVNPIDVIGYIIVGIFLLVVTYAFGVIVEIWRTHPDGEDNE